jgi:hypothetical protein
MKLRKLLILLAFLLPISLIIGILTSLIYTSYFHESPEVSWPLALSLAVLMTLFFMWYNRRDLKR